MNDNDIDYTAEKIKSLIYFSSRRNSAKIQLQHLLEILESCGDLSCQRVARTLISNLKRYQKLYCSEKQAMILARNALEYNIPVYSEN